MRRMTLPFVLVLAALALAAAGCGGDESANGGGEPAPPPAEPAAGEGGDLLADAVAAAQGIQSAHYVLDANVTVQAAPDAADPQLAVFAQGPIALHLEGDAGENAFTADGSVQFAGQTFTGQVLAGEHELYVNLLGQWYGSADTGLGDVSESSGATGTDPQQAVQSIRERFGEVISGDVSDGPEIDGVATMKFEGTLNVDGIVALATELGADQPTAEDVDKLRVVAEATTVVMLFGKDDKLPRRFELHLALSGEELAMLGEGGGSLADVESVAVDVTLDLSDFGKEVSFEAPGQFAPLEQVLGSLFGLTGAAP